MLGGDSKKQEVERTQQRTPLTNVNSREQGTFNVCVRPHLSLDCPSHPQSQFCVCMCVCARLRVCVCVCGTCQRDINDTLAAWLADQTNWNCDTSIIIITWQITPTEIVLHLLLSSPGRSHRLKLCYIYYYYHLVDHTNWSCVTSIIIIIWQITPTEIVLHLILLSPGRSHRLKLCYM